LATKTRLGADFRARFITAAIGGPMVLLSIVLGGASFNLAVIIVGVVAAIEFQTMIRPNQRAALLMTILTILACIEGVALGIPVLLPLAVILFLGLGFVETAQTNQPKSYFFIRNYFYSIIGALYIGIPLGLLIVIRDGNNGLLWTAMLFVNNWSTDAFALIGGRITGRHKLAPHISPGKTIEGAFIGLALGSLIGIAIALAGDIAPGLAMLANIVIALSVEIGDLFESWVKRRLAVKDSGSILPGHGGFLDRIDGTLVAAVILYLIIRLFG
jgi:phosphatidate cytidylyltransferase